MQKCQPSTATSFLLQLCHSDPQHRLHPGALSKVQRESFLKTKVDSGDVEEISPGSAESQNLTWKTQGTDGWWAVGKAGGIRNPGPQDGAPPWETAVCKEGGHCNRWPAHLPRSNHQVGLMACKNYILPEQRKLTEN